ncbi:MAG: NUDIX domain-containing protein [Christiangramia sp.]|uniref:Putative Nudix-like regulator n=1 Tax=Christiangramia flava JLT2011 TaxID=1229726 RepID=A0A1L7I2Y5_9FLAO|nr:NUDIX domain-containing protein [Christiangramia flava]APU67574.1 putative Nudix-like regulator [Christiangramia flava JLT2011]OSS40159.1 Nudix-like regulator [Christiangramia flava JLT2011]
MIDSYSSEDKVLLAVDCIIFGFDEEDLKILLIKRDFEPEKGKWSLMGGFLKKNENLDEAANRILENLTGINNVYMEQLHSYSKIDRDPAQRTISVAYFALINIQEHNEELIEQYSAQWFSIAEAPELIFDHNSMVKHAISRLRYRTSKEPIGFELLPPKFTMRQLQKLYESILDEKLDKRNFINKINSMDILIKLEEKDMSSSRKGSFLHQFDHEKYEKKKAKGFDFKV